MKKGISELAYYHTEAAFRERIISCVYANNPEIDVFEYTTSFNRKKLETSLFKEGEVSVELSDERLLRAMVKCQYLVNMNTMRREVRRSITNLYDCRFVLFDYLYQTKKRFKRSKGEILGAITESEKNTFARYVEELGINGLQHYKLEIGTDNVSTLVSSTNDPLMKIAIEPLAFEQRIAFRDVLLSELNLQTYKNGSMKAKYVSDGTTSIRIEMNWFK